MPVKDSEKILKLLERVEKDDLYQFLGMDQSASAVDLKKAAQQKWNEIHNKGKRGGAWDDRKQLAGLCQKVFADESSKREYDSNLKRRGGEDESAYGARNSTETRRRVVRGTNWSSVNWISVIGGIFYSVYLSGLPAAMMLVSTVVYAFSSSREMKPVTHDESWGSWLWYYVVKGVCIVYFLPLVAAYKFLTLVLALLVGPVPATLGAVTFAGFFYFLFLWIDWVDSNNRIQSALVRDASTGAVSEPASNRPAAQSRGPAEDAFPAGITAGGTEASLGLDRSARRRIQAGLQAAGFDPGPVDGQFGPGTRAAIGQWQAARGAVATGYLNAADAEQLLVVEYEVARQDVDADASRRVVDSSGIVQDGGDVVSTQRRPPSRESTNATVAQPEATVAQPEQRSPRESVDVGEAGRPDLPPVVEPVRVGGNVPHPSKVWNVTPEYPRLARLRRIEGTVILEVTVDRQGEVSNVAVLRSPEGLGEAAVDAVRQWRYEPTIVNGGPVSIIFTETVRFEI